MEAQNKTRTVTVGKAMRSTNSTIALQNRQAFKSAGVCVLNMLSSPGSGKTALLERTARELGQNTSLAIIVGDLATENDANRLKSAGARALQITTGDVCHLDASMVERAIDEIGIEGLDLLFIENVGNLVCPASYDLGESIRVVLLSVTEGEDKPLKYPTIFKDIDLAIVTKVDLAPYLDYNLNQAIENIHNVAPQADVITLSSKTGDGIEEWYRFLNARAFSRTSEQGAV